MKRRMIALGLVMAAMLAGIAGSAFAQTPPSERDLRIYAGLHDAAARGDVAEIEKLIAEGEKPNIQDANSRTPLHVAAFLRQARRGTRAAAARRRSECARRPALRHHHHRRRQQRPRRCCKIALDGGGNERAVTSPYDGTALIAAAHRGHVEIVRALIAAKAPLDHVNNLGWTALLEAVVLGNGGANHTAVVDALVKAGADVTVPDRHGTTALGHARRRGYSQIARILEAAGGR